MERFRSLKKNPAFEFISKSILNLYFKYQTYILKKKLSLSLKKINLGGYSFYYLDSNKKAPLILFLYGLLDSILSFKKLAFYLQEHFRIILLDTPGYGKNQLPQIRYLYQIDIFADLIYEFILTINVNNIILCGHSMGGLIAQKIALLDSNKKIKKLILISSANAPHQEREKIQKILPPKNYFYVKKFFEMIFYKKKVQINRFVAWLLIHYWNDWRNDFLAFNILKNETKVFHGEKIKEIKIPTLILTGKYDKITPLEMTKKMNQLLKNSQFKVFESSHSIHIEEAKEISKEIINFSRET